MGTVRLRRQRSDFEWSDDPRAAARAWEAAAIDHIEAAGHEADVEITRTYPNWLPAQNPPELRDVADAADEAGLEAAQPDDEETDDD